MKSFPDITIVTLFGGRYNLLEPYLDSLDKIDYPKNKLHLLWITNCNDTVFKDVLERQFQKRSSLYKDKKIVFCSEIPSSPLVVEEGKGSEEHAEIVAALYNIAISHVKTPLFFSLEDDVGVPSFTLKELLKHHNNPNVVYSCGAIFDRHQGGLFAWNLKKVRRIVATDDMMTSVEDYLGIDIDKPWGVQKVGASTLAVSLINTKAVKSIGENPFKAKHTASIYLIGCDIVLCLDFIE